MKTYTAKEEEIAQQISNDISEDINNKYSKKDLRMAVRYWADQNMLARQELYDLRMQNLRMELGVEIAEELRWAAVNK